MQEAAAAETGATVPSEACVHGSQLPLSFVPTGSTVRVIKVRGKGDLRHHLENLGFVEGAQVTVVTENAGNLIVEVKGTQVALDKQVALKVIAG